MVDPIVTVPLIYFLFDCLPMSTADKPIWTIGSFDFSKDILQKLLLMVGIGVYVEGHGIHTFTTIVKDPVKVFLVSQNVANGQEIYSWIRNDWEHLISHYIYLAGFILSQLSILWRYDTVRSQAASQWPLRERWLFHLSALINGLLFAAIAVNFPYGILVLVPVSIVLLLGYLSVNLSRYGREQWKQMALLDGRHLVWHLFILGYVVWFLAFLILYVVIEALIPNAKEKIL